MFVVLLHSDVSSMLSHEGSVPITGLTILSVTVPATFQMTMSGMRPLGLLSFGVGVGSGELVATLGTGLGLELSEAGSSSNS